MFPIARSPALPQRPSRATGSGNRSVDALACADRGQGLNERLNLRAPRTLPAG